MALEPITRQEKIIAGQDLKPITRMEKFLKEYGGGAITVTITKHVDYNVTPNVITYSIDKTAEEIQNAYRNGSEIKWHLINDIDEDFGFLNVAASYDEASLSFELSSVGSVTESQGQKFLFFDRVLVFLREEGNELKCVLRGATYSYSVTLTAGSEGFI